MAKSHVRLKQIPEVQAMSLLLAVGPASLLLGLPREESGARDAGSG
jgi:hypothetical protein